MYAACSMTSAALVSFESSGEVLQVPLRELARKTPLQKMIWRVSRRRQKRTKETFANVLETPLPGRAVQRIVAKHRKIVAVAGKFNYCKPKWWWWNLYFLVKYTFWSNRDASYCWPSFVNSSLDLRYTQDKRLRVKSLSSKHV